MHTAAAIRSHSRVALFILAAFFAAPSTSHAATAIATNQVLPPNQQTCPVVGATDITPYVYDGALNSFDITVSDPSYVAISGTVGDTPVSFEYMTRWFDANGGVRMHVDLPSIALTRDMPVTITLVSAHPKGSPITCIATVTTVVPAVNGYIPQPTPSVPASGNTGSNTVPTHQQPAYPWNHISYTQPTKPVSAPATHGPTATTATTTHIPALVTATHSLGDVCTSKGGPAKLWTALLVLYAIFVWVIAVMRGKDLESSDWNVGLVVAAFLGLLFFWYISAVCRTGSWAPILATIIACTGLIALTQSTNKDDSTLLLQNPQH